MLKQRLMRALPQTRLASEPQGPAPALRKAAAPLDPMTSPRVLIADSDPTSRRKWAPLVEGLRANVTEVDSGDALAAQLTGGERFDLVLSASRLATSSALQVLARVRQMGITTPFVILASMHGSSMRVFVSDGDGIVLSSRMLDAANFSTLLGGLVTRSDGGRAR